MKIKRFLFVLVVEMLLALPLVAQELFIELEQELFGSSEFFINDIVARPLNYSKLDGKRGDTIYDYQAERQFIDSYMKQINPNLSAGELKVLTGLVNDKHLSFDVIYKQIPVDGYDLTLHPLSDTTYVIMGAKLFSNDISVVPTLTKEQAIENLKLSNYLITDETILSSRLVIFKDLGTAPYLCYKMEVLIDPFEHYYYYVSAVNGDIIFNEILSRELGI